MRRGIFAALVSQRRRCFVAAVVLLALLPRVLVPVGYMPEHATSGALPVVLRMCASGFPAALLAFSHEAQMASGQMDHAAHLAHLRHAGHADHDAAGTEHCVFSALAANALLAAHAGAPLLATILVRLPARTASSPAGRLRHVLPQARGPPALS
jgi:hypothetical protein